MSGYCGAGCIQYSAGTFIANDYSILQLLRSVLSSIIELSSYWKLNSWSVQTINLKQ